MKNKRVQVIMLPTKNKSNIIKIGNSIKLHYKEEKTLANSTASYTNQYLYFTVDENPKVGDWCVYFGTDIMKHDNNEIWDKDKCKKIISTTDTKLNFNKSKTFKDVSPVTKVVTFDTVVLTKLLPQPPKSFIEAFCKAGGIKKVIVEYEEKYIEPPSNIHSNRGYFITQPKVNSQNEITIHPIKNSWDREEVIKLYKSAYKNGFVDREKNNNYNDSWIEKTYKK